MAGRPVAQASHSIQQPKHMNNSATSQIQFPDLDRGSSPLKSIATAAAIAVLLLAALAQTACNTTKGVGRDVEAVGRGVERAGSGR